MSEINFNNIQKNSDDEEVEDYDNYVEDIVEDIDEDMNGDDEQQDIDYQDEDEDENEDENEDEDENGNENEEKKNENDFEDVVIGEDGDDDDNEEDKESNKNKQDDDSLLKSESDVGGSILKSKEMTLISDYRKYKHLKTLSCSSKVTRPILTKYEKTSILGQRAQQIVNGSNILIDMKTLKIKNPLEIARKELKEGLIPFIVRRPLPNGTYEDWKVSELKDINF
jgi:DNA-directed RNA polymerase subunit K/omega